MNIINYVITVITLFILNISFINDAAAVAIPTKSTSDKRIQYVNFDENNVTKINGAIGNVTTIVFAKGEKAKHYGSGFSAGWEFQARDNLFFMKPKDKEANTNLSIVTNLGRIYQIDVALAERKNATFLLKYKYPEFEKSLKEQIQLDNIKQDLLNGSIKRSAPFNFHYSMNFGTKEESKYIAPTLIYDDNRFTYIRFADITDFPAVYAVNADGEVLVNSHLENKELVIHGIYPEFRIRAGLAVVGIYNDAFVESLETELDTSSNSTLEDFVRETK